MLHHLLIHCPISFSGTGCCCPLAPHIPSLPSIQCLGKNKSKDNRKVFYFYGTGTLGDPLISYNMEGISLKTTHNPTNPQPATRSCQTPSPPGHGFATASSHSQTQHPSKIQMIDSVLVKSFKGAALLFKIQTK
jgi:hypothetical protein